MAGAGTKRHTKGKDQSTIKEIQHLENVFGTDLRNYSHKGYARAELPYTVRDATTTTANKRKRK